MLFIAMFGAITRFVADEDGNDLVEYILLATLIGTAGAIALQALPGIMNVVYGNWDAGAQSLWEPDDPTP